MTTTAEVPSPNSADVAPTGPNPAERLAGLASRIPAEFGENLAYLVELVPAAERAWGDAFVDEGTDQAQNHEPNRGEQSAARAVAERRLTEASDEFGPLGRRVEAQVVEKLVARHWQPKSDISAVLGGFLGDAHPVRRHAQGLVNGTVRRGISKATTEAIDRTTKKLAEVDEPLKGDLPEDTQTALRDLGAQDFQGRLGGRMHALVTATETPDLGQTDDIDPADFADVQERARQRAIWDELRIMYIFLQREIGEAGVPEEAKAQIAKILATARAQARGRIVSGAAKKLRASLETIKTFPDRPYAWGSLVKDMDDVFGTPEEGAIAVQVERPTHPFVAELIREGEAMKGEGATNGKVRRALHRRLHPDSREKLPKDLD